MKWIVLCLIRVYWILPTKYRRKCIFKESCSHFVYRSAKENGFRKGISCFLKRRTQCRTGYQIYYGYSTSIEIKLFDGTYITENELSETMLKEITALKHFLLLSKQTI